jgi:hypothetical protein
MTSASASAFMIVASMPANRRSRGPCRGAKGDAAEDVAAADHDRDLDAEAGDSRHLVDDHLDRLTIDAEEVVPHQRLAGQLEKDALVLRLRHRPRSDPGP